MQLTDFKKLFEDEVLKLKGDSSSAPQNHPLLRQFREAVWVCYSHTYKVNNKTVFGCHAI